ncbi:SPOC domain-containing 1 [Pelobates cultripes]|nr:SPOC domain-containing 1 [Pelobates cultripes]
MSATEMAAQELANWRIQERKHALELIEKEERQPYQIQMTKLTHKGLIEIDTMPDQNLTLEDLSDSVWQPQDSQQDCISEKMDTTSQHKSHLLDQNCLICKGLINPPGDADLSQWVITKKPEKIWKHHITDGNQHSSCIEKKNKKLYDPDTRLTDPADSSVWKGFLHMFSIKQFKVTAMPVSGYSSHLCQDLPKVLTSEGCILPESVWEYVDRIWPECTKDMCVIRLNPRTSSDAVSYARLYSYLNRKLRYAIIRSHGMEAFLVPLPAGQPIPQRLRPLGGPGLEDNHPILLLILLLPSHPSWTAYPKKSSKKHKEGLDIPDDIFSDILADVEREERQMAEQGLPPPGFPNFEQWNQNSEDTGEEVGMPEIMNMLQNLSNGLQFPGEFSGIIGESQGANIMPPLHVPNAVPSGLPYPSFPLYPEAAYPGWHGMLPPTHAVNPLPIDPANLFSYPLSQIIPPNFLPDQHFTAGPQPFT